MKTSESKGLLIPDDFLLFVPLYESTKLKITNRNSVFIIEQISEPYGPTGFILE